MNVNEVIDKIKERAKEYAKNHATENAKAVYLQGKRDAAHTFLAMVKSEGVSAIVDVAKEVLKHEPGQPDALWILENESSFTKNV